MNSKTNILFITVSFIGILCIISGCNIQPPQRDKYWDFTLNDVQEKPVHLKELIGNPIVLCFFSTNCSSCIKEIPHLNTLYQKYKDTQNLLVIGIGLGSNVPDFVQSQGITYQVLIDSNQNVADLYKVHYLPHLVFISRQGEITNQVEGYHNESQLEQYLQSIL